MLAKVYLITVCILCAGMGGWLLFKRLVLFLSGCRATGTWVRWEARGGAKTYHHPVVRFSAADGREYEFVGSPGSTRPRKRARYAILYPPDAPQAAMIHGPLAYWAAPIAFFILAAGAWLAARG